VCHVPDLSQLAALEAEVGGDPLWQAFRTALPDLSTMLMAPVPGTEDVLAVISLGACQDRPFSRLQQHAVQAVCADLGRALEQSLMFEHQADLLDRLQALDRQKTDFLSTVSHELRTPLTSIRGYLELLEDDGDALPPQVGQVLDVIGRNVTRLGGLIEDLLTLGRIESGAVRFTPRRFDVVAMAESVVRSLAPQAARAQVTIRLDVPDCPVHLHGDEHQIERVLLNLVNNAVKFTPAGGRVGIEVDQLARPDVEGAEQPWVRITVSDTGIGIPIADQQNLFNRFFRAANAVSAQIPGTGLGLSIVRRIVEAHGGDVDLASRPGQGTTFGVSIPCQRLAPPDLAGLVPVRE
jgi:two-component system, OmpR family, phosphate regulon sensor histidine kinase PhoR